MTHIIKLQLIECTLNNKQDAFNLQHQISRYYQEIILPVLEKIFDELADDDTLICLDHLEIDLGVIPATYIQYNVWPEEIERKFSSQVRDEILKQLHHRIITREHSRAGIFRQWLFYMRNGYLGWNASRFSDEQKNNVLETLAIDYNSAAELRRQLIADPVVSKRISRQHNAAFLVNLVKTLTAINQDPLVQYFDEIIYLMNRLESWKRINSTISEVQLRQELWEQSLIISAGTAALHPQQIAEKIMQGLSLTPDTLKKLLKRKSLQNKLILPVLDDLYRSVVSRSINERHEKEQGTGKAPEEKDKNNFIDKRAGPGTAIDNASEDMAQPAAKSKTGKPHASPFEEPVPTQSLDVQISGGVPVSEEGIFVQHAGLILLHAFLPSLFKKLQWTSEGKFLGPEYQQKGIYLLHWLATGEPHAPEYELVMPKFLCTYPLQQLIPTDIELKANEREEGNNMLAAVIQHWEVLKKTSVDGLRQGFLQRNGKLFSNNDKTWLHVENGSIDMLLDHLPWNLSMIKLPWMNEILRVEWR